MLLLIIGCYLLVIINGACTKPLYKSVIFQKTTIMLKRVHALKTTIL